MVLKGRILKGKFQTFGQTCGCGYEVWSLVNLYGNELKSQ